MIAPPLRCEPLPRRLLSGRSHFRPLLLPLLLAVMSISCQSGSSHTLPRENTPTLLCSPSTEHHARPANARSCRQGGGVAAWRLQLDEQLLHLVESAMERGDLAVLELEQLVHLGHARLHVRVLLLHPCHVLLLLPPV